MDQEEFNLKSTGITNIPRFDFEEPLSECESSVGSLTMTITQPTDLQSQIFAHDRYLVEEHENQLSESDRCTTDCSNNKYKYKGTNSLNNWLYYQNEYDQLNRVLQSLESGFHDLLSLVSKYSKNQIEPMKTENFLPKRYVNSFYKCFKPLEIKDNCSVKKNFEMFQFKIWKKHYCMLLDTVDIVYKDCQLLNKLRCNKNENNISSIHRGNILLNEFQKVFEKFLSGFELTNVIHDSQYGFEISTSLLIELIAQCRIFRGELERITATKDRLFYILKTAKDQRSKLKSYVSNLRNDLQCLLAKMKLIQKNESPDTLLTSHQIASRSLNSKMSLVEKQEYQKKLEDLERILKEEELRRKKLHNKLQELIGNIRVYCRIRPQQKTFLKITSEDKLIIMGEYLPDKITKHWYGKTSKCFIFDRVFGPKSDQTEIFDAVEELITSCVDGYNVCIMAYGQTGSGKTHTMMGTMKEPGVNRRAIHRLLSICESRLQWKYKLFLSMVEIYQEEVKDILTEKVSPNIKIMSNQDDEIMLQGLTEHEVKCENDIFLYFDKGEKNRTVASTLLNISSSRSHLIVLIKVYGENKIHLTTSIGTLTLCDLAGSENITKSGAMGERFNEATCINKSLTTLGRVFDSLRNHQKPSYRETKLTYLLKPTLGGDSKCLLFVNVRCEPENAEETLRAIHFGINAMQVAPEKAQQRSNFRKTLGKITI